MSMYPPKPTDSIQRRFAEQPTLEVPAILAYQDTLNRINRPEELPKKSPFQLTTTPMILHHKNSPSSIKTGTTHITSSAKNDDPIESSVEKNALNSSPVVAVRKKHKWRQKSLAIIVMLGFILSIYLIWHPASSPPSGNVITSTSNALSLPTTTQTTTDAAGTPTSDTDTIQVYVVGAVQKPGVYTLPANARVYQLIQAAGGPLENANLTALNMASRLSDGQEIYVTKIGEKPPTYTGGVPGPETNTGSTVTSNTTNSGNQSSDLVNINTASSDEMRQKLHVSSTTAQNIITYRQQHGSYKSIDELLVVISKAIYDRIKGSITV